MKHGTVFTKNKESSYIQMLPSEIVNISLCGLEAQAKSHKNPTAKHASFMRLCMQA